MFEIEGGNNQLCIPDGIVFVNGISVVVLEFKSKSAVKGNTTIMDAYKQLTVRYCRDFFLRRLMSSARLVKSWV